MKTVVVFGATGGIGVYLVSDLLSAGYDVVAVGRRLSDNGYFESIGAKYVSINIEKPIDRNLLPAHVFAVVHLAGAMPARMKGYKPSQYIDSIMKGALNVLDYAVSAEADRIIYSHSISDISYAYGTTQGMDETIPGKFTPNDDHSVYSICKMAAVNLVEHYFYKHGLKRFIIRIPNVYIYHPDPYFYVDGERQWQNYRLVIEKATKGDDIEIWGDPNKVRDMLYIKDMTGMMMCALVANVDGGIYNAGTGIGTSLEDQIRGIVNVFDEERQSSVTYHPDKPSLVQYVMDVTKAKNELGYKPRYGYYEYLHDFKKEMKANRFKTLYEKPI